MKQPNALLYLLFWRQIIAGLTCILILSSCTMKSLYLQLDRIVPQFVDDYLPLNEKQKNALDITLQKTLDWHRNRQLPDYINWLRLFRQDIEKGLNQSTIYQHTKHFEQFYLTLLSRLADDFSSILFTIDQEQRKSLFDKLNEGNLDLKKKYIDKNETILRDELTEKIAERYEYWLNNIEPAQLTLIQKASERLILFGKFRLQKRLKQQQRLKTILASNRSLKQKQFALKSLLTQPDNLMSNEYQKTREHNRAILIKLTVDISKTLDSEQKQHLLQKVDDYITLFQQLSVKK